MLVLLVVQFWQAASCRWCTNSRCAGPMAAARVLLGVHASGLANAGFAAPRTLSRFAYAETLLPLCAPPCIASVAGAQPCLACLLRSVVPGWPWLLSPALGLHRSPGVCGTPLLSTACEGSREAQPAALSPGCVTWRCSCGRRTRPILWGHMCPLQLVQLTSVVVARREIGTLWWYRPCQRSCR